MNRRDTIKALGAMSAALLPPGVMAGQRRKFARIAILWNSPTPTVRQEMRQALREVGYIEGENLAIDTRDAQGHLERLPDLVMELLALKPDVIFTHGAFAFVHAVKERAGKVPIVFFYAWDPVGTGLVTSLSRPGGNMTGTSGQSNELDAKRIELLKEVVPGLSRVAALWYMGTAGEGIFRTQLRQTEQAARPRGIEVASIAVPLPMDYERAFSRIEDSGAGAVIVFNGPVFENDRQRLGDMALQHRLPTMFSWAGYVEASGLISYGADVSDLFQRSVAQVVKILDGANPGDLPVEQPTKFDLAINLKTARALGITIPQSVILRADEVIQ